MADLRAQSMRTESSGSVDDWRASRSRVCRSRFSSSDTTATHHHMSASSVMATRRM